MPTSKNLQQNLREPWRICLAMLNKTNALCESSRNLQTFRLAEEPRQSKICFSANRWLSDRSVAEPMFLC